MKIILLSITLLINLTVWSATYIVTNTNDSGTGSLRQAILDANSAFGLDNIYFSIPITDANYNASTGVWTIILASDLPMISGGYTNIDATTQTSNQGNTNTQGPEIALNGENTLTYAFRVVSPNNTFKGFIIGQFEYAIQVYGTSATNNTIINNYIGTDRTGTFAYSNQYGIGISGDATTVTISNNLISGNTIGGIACSPANNITISGNKIGTDILGLNPLPNPTGIILNNSANNIIGGNSTNERNIISGNTDGGILINNLASENNIIIGNYIGVNVNCTDTIPNGNGIMIISSPNNVVGGSNISQRNIISGNKSAGILINGTGAENNTVIGNYIGIDSSGTIAISNHHGVIIKADANKNTIGGNTTNERNIISANWEIGVYIEASDSNIVSGNFIGTDYTGTTSFTIGISDTLIQANGVEINTISKYNIIGGNMEGERNIISGNRVYGAIYYGNVSQNNICGNYIGTDVTGSFSIPNATGICVDDASHNNIMENNLLSGNISYGLFIVTTGSYHNIFRGNLVGTNADGTDTIPNDVGLLIAGGAKYNQIGGSLASDRNIFSGNSYGGIEIVDTGTDYNEIKGNYIGTDITGNQPLPNTLGIGISSLVTATKIDRNVISGNLTFGIVLTDACDSNLVTNNLIGLGADGTTVIGNKASGIAIGQGATNNTIGGPGQGNTIAYNDSAGVVIIDNYTINNKISENSIFDNEFLGIDIMPESVNINDVGDTDNGPNDLMNFPDITSATYNSTSGNTLIIGTIDTQNPQNTTIEVFKSAPDLLLNHGEGQTYLGNTNPDNSGNWSIIVSGIITDNKITATATNVNGSTSEFSMNNTTILDIDDIENSNLSFEIFPNPNNGNFTISFEPRNQNEIEIFLYDIVGQKIETLYQNKSEKSKNTININNPLLNEGVYFIVVKSDNKLIDIKKIEIIK